MVNKATHAWQTAVSTWKPEDRKKLKDPKKNFEKWEKLQLAMQKKLGELAAIDQAIWAETVGIRHVLDESERHLGQHDIATWKLMRKLVSTIHQVHGEKVEKLLTALHVFHPEKLD